MTIYSQPSGSPGTGDYIGNKSFIIMVVDVRQSPFQFSRGRGDRCSRELFRAFPGSVFWRACRSFFEGAVCSPIAGFADKKGAGISARFCSDREKLRRSLSPCYPVFMCEIASRISKYSSRVISPLCNRL